MNKTKKKMKQPTTEEVKESITKDFIKYQDKLIKFLLRQELKRLSKNLIWFNIAKYLFLGILAIIHIIIHWITGTWFSSFFAGIFIGWLFYEILTDITKIKK